MDKDDGRELCDSCGADNLSARDHLCRGCGMIVCQPCVDVFDHFGGGLHGKGDPMEAVALLRTQLTTQAARIRDLEGENEAANVLIMDLFDQYGLDDSTAAFADYMKARATPPRTGTVGKT